MKVKELIKQLQEIENKEQNVYVWAFADIGSGWSESTTDIKIRVEDDGIHLDDD